MEYTAEERRLSNYLWYKMQAIEELRERDMAEGTELKELLDRVIPNATSMRELRIISEECNIPILLFTYINDEPTEGIDLYDWDINTKIHCIDGWEWACGDDDGIWVGFELEEE